MADRYCASGQQDTTAPTPGSTCLSLASPGQVIDFREFIISPVDPLPGDAAIRWLVRRGTALGTGTVITIGRLDGSSAPASAALARENMTVEPTYTTTLFDMDINQRSSYRHIMQPSRTWKAAAGGGLGWTGIHSTYSGATKATAYWEE